MVMNGKYYLVYVKPVNLNIEGKFIYDLLFSDTPENVWGLYWDEENPSSCGDLTPEKTTYNIIKRIESEYKFTTVQEMGCLTMEHVTMGVMALSWVDINCLEEYPPSRAVLHFGDTMENVERILSQIDIKTEEDYGE